MTDERPIDRLLRDWGFDTDDDAKRKIDEAKRKAAEKEAEQERKREATRLELENRPPEPHPKNQPTLQGPGMRSSFVNNRAETPEQRAARLNRERDGGRGEPPKEPEPPSLDKAAERVREIPEDRAARRMLAPWEKDPRWGA